MRTPLLRRVIEGVLLTIAGCGGTVASVHLPPLPEPPPSKFESFDDWDARVNPTTRPATTTAPTTVPTAAL